MTKLYKILVLFGVAIGAGVCVFLIPPIAQDPHYHDFADQRTFLGIPNFCDVLSNLPFLIVGVTGLQFLQTKWNNDSFQSVEKQLWLVLFSVVALASFGSAYYHWAPDNHRLVWDRLFIALALITLLSIIVTERIGYTPYLFPMLVFAGVASVFYWDYTERQGLGDLRLYALAQFLPILLVPLICILFPAPGTRWLVCAFGWYVLAKLFEHFDKAIFEQLKISGHTLKHLVAGLGAYALLRYLKYRKG